MYLCRREKERRGDDERIGRKQNGNAAAVLGVWTMIDRGTGNAVRSNSEGCGAGNDITSNGESGISQQNEPFITMLMNSPAALGTSRRSPHRKLFHPEYE